MTALPILWTASAEDDLIAITDYIAERNPSAARRLAREIRASVLPVATFPYMFRESEKMSGCREIVVHSNYLVFYRVTATQIEVINIKHGMRQFPIRD